METYRRIVSDLRLRLLNPRFLGIIKNTNKEWKALKSLKEWENIQRVTGKDVPPGEGFADENLKCRSIEEILDWILWEEGNLVETTFSDALPPNIWTERPFEIVRDEVCLFAFTVLKEWLKWESPFLRELAMEIRIYFTKLFVIENRSYEQHRETPSEAEFEEWMENAINEFVHQNNLTL